MSDGADPGDGSESPAAPRSATVAIVGRPNVGKSTLFNRLIGRRKAIVHDQPGVTRDRIAGEFELEERRVQLIDTGGLIPGKDPMGLNRQVMAAVEESDLLLLVVDGREGLMAADERIWEQLRPLGKPTVLVVNKEDTRQAKEGFAEFYALGIGELVLLSAEHGRGFDELRRVLAAALPAAPAEEARPDLPSLAIVGRPNVGKSSLLNRIVGAERALVSPRPGTTRDPIDTTVRWGESDYLLIDTAGIRRRRRLTGAPEELAVMMARRQLERCDLALLVIDASSGVHSGDLAIAGAIEDLGRAAVVAVNKWDLLEELSRRRLEESWERLARVLHDPARVNVSALTGRGVDKLPAAVDETLVRYRTELPTAAVNRLFGEALRRQAPPSTQGRPWKVYYGTQVATGPPTFLLFANRKLPRHSTYRRYLENRIRAELDLRGVPVRLAVRQR